MKLETYFRTFVGLHYKVVRRRCRGSRRRSSHLIECRNLEFVGSNDRTADRPHEFCRCTVCSHRRALDNFD